MIDILSWHIQVLFVMATWIHGWDKILLLDQITFEIHGQREMNILEIIFVTFLCIDIEIVNGIDHAQKWNCVQFGVAQVHLFHLIIWCHSGVETMFSDSSGTWLLRFHSRITRNCQYEYRYSRSAPNSTLFHFRQWII